MDTPIKSYIERYLHDENDNPIFEKVILLVDSCYSGKAAEDIDKVDDYDHKDKIVILPSVRSDKTDLYDLGISSIYHITQGESVFYQGSALSRLFYNGLHHNQENKVDAYYSIISGYIPLYIVTAGLTAIFLLLGILCTPCLIIGIIGAIISIIIGLIAIIHGHIAANDVDNLNSIKDGFEYYKEYKNPSILYARMLRGTHVPESYNLHQCSIISNRFKANGD